MTARDFFFAGICFTILLGVIFLETGKLKTRLFYCLVITVLLSTSAYRGRIVETITWDIESLIFPPDKQVWLAHNIKSRKLPERVISEIGNKSVDVLRYETSYIYYNNFRYNPRPIVQSYSAYDKKLIDINYH